MVSHQLDTSWLQRSEENRAKHKHYLDCAGQKQNGKIFKKMTRMEKSEGHYKSITFGAKSTDKSGRIQSFIYPEKFSPERERSWIQRLIAGIVLSQGW